MVKHVACAAAMSSSGLVFPAGASVRAAQVTGRTASAPLPELTLPLPPASDPSHVTFAVLCAISIVAPFLRVVRPAPRHAPSAFAPALWADAPITNG